MTYTDDDIRKLREGAAAANDCEMVGICTRALDGWSTERAECFRVMDEVRAEVEHQR